MLLVSSQVLQTYAHHTLSRGADAFGWTDGVCAAMTLFALAVFVVFFAMGVGPTTWVLASEILPSRERNSGLAIATFINRELR